MTEFTLPSGTTVKLRKLGPAGLARVQRGLPVIDVEQEGGKPQSIEQRDNITETNIRMICACVAEPRLSADDPPPAGFRYIDDVVEVEDYVPLLEEIAKMHDWAGNLRPLSAAGGT